MVKFGVIGDMGTGGSNQRKVAKSLKRMINREKLTFVVGLGDNIYNCGANSLDDPQFQTKFEQPYSIISDQIKFYMVLGNHDYGEHYCPKVKDREQFQIQYGIQSQKKGKKWVMPDEHYSFKRGNCEFFALNPNIYKLNDKEFKEQLKYMLPRIKRSTAKWKIAFGHQPWISVGDHGNAPPKLNRFFEKLMNNGDIDLYMCGDDHNKQIIEKKVKNGKTVTLLVCGTGGREVDKPYNLENVRDKDRELLFFSPYLGISTVETINRKLIITIYDVNDMVEYIHEIEK